MDDEFLHYLIDKSKTLIVGPDEIITYFGSINREMYFICKGLCLKQTEIIFLHIPENNTYETIGPGSSIGFSSLLFGLPSLNNVCTLTHCVLIHINVQTFNAALQQAPLLYRTVYRTRQLILAKYQSNYEVKMIENPHYTKRKRRLKLKYKKLNHRLIENVHSWSMILVITTCKYLHHNDVARFTEGNVTKIPGMMIVQKEELNLYCYEHSWLNRSLYHNYTTVSQVYFTAVYFVFQTMTGIGFGDIYAESGVEITIIILILLSGLAFYGYVMTDIISNSARRKHGLLAYESKFLHLISYMQQQKVDSQLSLRVQDSLQYKWNRTRNVNIYSLLSQMNSTLHEDVVLYLYEATLRHVPMFENADHSFFRVIAKELREEYFIEGDTVVRNNDIVQDIYIIHKGSVELSNAHNMIPVIMGIGGVFGNVFEKDKSLCGISVRALKNLDLLCLNVETFRKLLKRYELITELPRTLKIDLMTSIYGKLIKDSYIFCRTERDFIRQLCLQLQHRTYFPGDYIVRDGDVDSCMYFIHKGDVGPGCSKTTGTAFITASPSRILQVQILTDGQNVNETVHEVLHKEEVFGIVQGLFKEIPHHFSFRALTIVDIASLKLNEWEYLLDFFPKSKDIIYQRVEEIYYTI
ncbi:cyclic nucleotide-gated cation channel subunit a [Holotrichia oblita]|uniref:Cyclic nucleotide-gated cation channel subunit a n=1 Tax=Holotrichia oblita TaxID=644536 RepID=A0ACB9SVT9_HOLOL|nr:cyclic nucleotide-gated cation channel subunit a [Holotrichia oblita]